MRFGFSLKGPTATVDATAGEIHGWLGEHGLSYENIESAVSISPPHDCCTRFNVVVEDDRLAILIKMRWHPYLGEVT